MGKESKDEIKSNEKESDIQSTSNNRSIESRKVSVKEEKKKKLLKEKRMELNQTIVPPEVVFNDEETFASEEIRNIVALSVMKLESMNEQIHNNRIFKNAMQEYIEGQWKSSLKKECILSPNLIPNTFCSFTFRGHQYISYKIKSSKHPKTDRISRRIWKRLKQLEQKWIEEVKTLPLSTMYQSSLMKTVTAIAKTTIVTKTTSKLP